MVFGGILRSIFDGSSDRTYPTTCEECSNPVEDPTAWKRETYTGYGTAVVDVCPHCDRTVQKYYWAN